MNCINKETWNYKQNKHQTQLNFNFVYWHGCLRLCALCGRKPEYPGLTTCQTALNIIK